MPSPFGPMPQQRGQMNGYTGLARPEGGVGAPDFDWLVNVVNAIYKTGSYTPPMAGGGMAGDRGDNGFSGLGMKDFLPRMPPSTVSQSAGPSPYVDPWSRGQMPYGGNAASPPWMQPRGRGFGTSPYFAAATVG